VVSIDEEAGNPPIGEIQAQVPVPAHSGGEIGGRAELAPPSYVRSVVDERRGRAIRKDQLRFLRAVLLDGTVRPARCKVKGDTPAPAPDSVVLLNDLLEVELAFGSELLDRIVCHRLSLAIIRHLACRSTLSLAAVESDLARFRWRISLEKLGVAC